MIGKAGYLADKADPRFVVTSLVPNSVARQLYEQLYWARGEMENPRQARAGDLFADRTSSPTFKANVLRLRLSPFAYVLIEALRRLGLDNTALVNATAGSIHFNLIKIGAPISVSVRRVKIAMRSSLTHQAEFIAAFHALGAAGWSGSCRVGSSSH